MRPRIVATIARKDLLAASRSRAVVLPMVLLPLVVLVILPTAMALVAGRTELAASTATDLDRLIAAMPGDLQSDLLAYTPRQRSVVLAVAYLVVPLFLIVPLMVASVLAADSFAGERERRTLEALLATPTTDSELLAGKLLGAWGPAVVVGLGGIALYGLAANLAAWPVMGEVFFPAALWLLLALWIGPAAAALGLGAMVLVSARVRGAQEAFQIGGVVVLPIVLLVVGQAAGLVFLNVRLGVLLGFLLWVIATGLLWLGRQTFHREALMSRE